ncbi:MAG: hypothetical protein M1469_00875 [Bacteroidetes bacterium]|nr:hypothetical protein [Bacteroidota bacterium]
MKSTTAFSLISLTILLASCTQSTSPTAPSIPQGISGQPFSLAGYGINLDSTYYKVWSDSSWEEYYMDTTISGTKYTVLLDNTGYEYFYGPGGYAGFLPYGGSLIMFDSAMAALPDTMIGGQTYTFQTTFSYQGSSNVLTDLETLVDTTTVAVPFGTFTNCRVLQSTGAINGVTQSATTYWYAKGPSDIIRQDYTGYTIQMAYGVVNDLGWGVTLSKEMPGAPIIDGNLISGKQKTYTPTSQPVEGIQSIAPMILKGVLR